MLLGLYGASSTVAVFPKSPGDDGNEGEGDSSGAGGRDPKQLSMKGLNNQRVKDIVVEIYDAAVKKIAESLECLKKSAVPLGWFSMDLWTSKASSEKYIGGSLAPLA